MKKVLQEKLYQVSDSVIESYSCDLLEHKVTMVFKKGSVRREVEFLRVATVYYVNGSGEERKNMPPVYEDSRLEVDDISVVQAPLDIEVRCDIPGWEDGCKGGGNIAIEIYNNDLVIEAAEVRIDGESFVIGDW